MKFLTVAVLLGGLAPALAGCAESAREVNALSAQQDQAATTDAVVTGIALVVFWPAAIALAATDDQAAELSAAKGHYEAITAQLSDQGCDLPAEPVPA